MAKEPTIFITKSKLEVTLRREGELPSVIHYLDLKPLYAAKVMVNLIQWGVSLHNSKSLMVREETLGSMWFASSTPCDPHT